MISRWRLARMVALAAVLAGAVSALYARDHGGDLPEAPRGATYLRETRTPDTYAREGFVELVSPILPPTSEDGALHINVFLKLPDGASIRVLDREGGGFTLRVPDGTTALRVESWGPGDAADPPSASWKILDVRGTSFAPDGEQFFVLRPVARGSPELLGLRWPRDAAQAEPTRALADLMRLGLLEAPRKPNEREAAASHLASLNACAGCHVPSRPPRERTTAPGVVSRGTDAAGLFQLEGVFRDRLPIETYRPRDANLGRPFLSYRCGLVVGGGEACPGGLVKDGVLDVRAGMRARDRHVIQVCSSRRAVARRLDRLPPEIAASIAECD